METEQDPAPTATRVVRKFDAAANTAAQAIVARPRVRKRCARSFSVELFETRGVAWFGCFGGAHADLRVLSGV